MAERRAKFINDVGLTSRVLAELCYDVRKRLAVVPPPTPDQVAVMTETLYMKSDLYLTRLASTEPGAATIMRKMMKRRIEEFKAQVKPEDAESNV